MDNSKRSLHLSLLGILSITAVSLHAAVANITNADIDLDDPIVKQKIRLFTASRACHVLLANTTAPTDGGSYCPPVWDNILCWPAYVAAGTLVSQPCPSYVSKFNHEEAASRRCTENGTWEEHPDQKYNGQHYTDFANCTKPRMPPVLMKHIPIVTQISTIGYYISLAALVLAISVLVFFKKLHCQRNTIHIHLFVSFCLRAVISVIRNSLLVEGLALPSDITYSQDGSIQFERDGDHWECKLLNTLWIYALIANYFWIFVEGLYLHTLIFFAVFSQTKQFFKIYIIIGWVLPLVFILTWALARLFHHNDFCWNTHSKGLYWIIEVPMMLTICINFFFFLNIVRVLFTKIRDCNTRDPKRYKKLAKSTLVLIPMFGVYYTVFIIVSRIENPSVSVVYIYMELPINSFQGAVVAMLFCFFNGEVQAEILKRWDRHRLRSLSLTSGRSSRAFSTGSFYTGRDRTSVCLGTLSSHATSPGDSDGNASSLRVPADPDSLDRDGKERSKEFDSMPMPDTHKPLPRVSISPKVSFRSDNPNLAGSLPYPQTSHPNESGNTLPDCITACGDQRTTRDGSGSKHFSNGERQEEQMVLIPANNFTDSCAASKSKGNCLSLVRGEQAFEDGLNGKALKECKGSNKETDSRQPNLIDINRLSTLDDEDTIIDESQPILS